MASSSSSAGAAAAAVPAPALASSSTTVAPSASASLPAEPSPDGESHSYGSSPPEVFDEADDECLFVRCHAPDEKPSFVWVCLGVGGGPLENDCSCYMVKPADRHWRDGTYVVEGGSWLGALSRVCEDPAPGKLSAFHDFDFSHSNASLRAGEIGSYAQAFLISHAHLDHILGLVLGCASLPGKRAVYGLKSTLENLLNIFDGKLWPKLASFKEDAPFIVYHLKPIETQVTLHLDDVMSTVPFSLSHGLASSTVPAPPTPTFFVPTNSTPPANYFGKRYSLPLNTLAPGSGPGGRPVPMKAIEASAAFLAGGGPRGTRPSFTSPFAPDQPVDRPESPEPTPPGGYSMAAMSSSPAGLTSLSQRQTETPSTDWTNSFDVNESGTMSSSYLNSRQRGPPSPSSPTSSGSTFKKSPLSLLSSARRPKTSAASEKESWGGPGAADGQAAGTGGAPTLLRSLSRSSVKSSGTGGSIPAPLQQQHAQHHHPSALQAPIAHSAAHITRSGKGGFREAAPRRLSIDRHPPTMDSTAFFLTNKQTGMDVLFFGDVEPDCISRSPRNKKVWSYAAHRFARGKLNAVFLECSFPAAQPVEFLWGHLSTHHLVDELVVLARMVKGERAVMEKDRQRERSRSQERRRKSSLEGLDGMTPRQTAANGQQQQQQGGPFDFGFFPDTSDGAGATSSSIPPSDSASSDMDMLSSLPQGSGLSASAGGPGGASVATEDLRDVLKGLTVIIVHVKQALFPSYADAPEDASSPPSATDGDGEAAAAKEKPEKAKVLDPRTMQVRLLQELREKEAETHMGVRFVMSKQGMRIEM